MFFSEGHFCKHTYRLGNESNNRINSKFLWNINMKCTIQYIFTGGSWQRSCFFAVQAINSVYQWFLKCDHQLSLGNLLEVPNLKLHSRPTQSETPGDWAQRSPFTIYPVIWYTIKPNNNHSIKRDICLSDSFHSLL